MIIPILLLLFVALAYLPGWWVRHVMGRYQSPDDRYPGTGAELVRHMADRLGLDELRIERGEAGQDHYDPASTTIRLSPNNHDGRSLTAITVAAHELGHAIQHADGMRLFHWRQRLVAIARPFQRLGVALIILSPILALLLRIPALLLWGVLAGLLSMIVLTVTHLLTLPVEVDASFGRALPLLERGGYLKTSDHEPARRILKAAAFTYVAQSLGSLINLGIWLRLLRPW